MTPVSISIVAITAAAMASLSVGQSAPGGAATPLDQQAQPSATQSDSVRVDSGGVLAAQQGRPDSIPTPRWEQPSPDDFKLGASRTYKFIYFVGVLAAGSVGLMVFLLIASYRRRKAESESMPLMLAPMPINAALITNEFPSQTNHVPLPQPVGENSNDSRESVSVRMPKPPEGTLQLLPGRLEIASGNDRMKEIRFVKMPGPTVVTFGRYAGEGHSHIQVDSPT